MTLYQLLVTANQPLQPFVSSKSKGVQLKSSQTARGDTPCDTTLQYKWHYTTSDTTCDTTSDSTSDTTGDTTCDTTCDTRLQVTLQMTTATPHVTLTATQHVTLPATLPVTLYACNSHCYYAIVWTHQVFPTQSKVLGQVTHTFTTNNTHLASIFDWKAQRCLDVEDQAAEGAYHRKASCV